MPYCDELAADGKSHYGRCRTDWLSAICRLKEWHAQFSPYERGAGNSSLLYVHVGKTGGTLVGNLLQAHGVAFDEVHTHPVQLTVAQRHAVFLVTIRDPVDRLLSGYNHHIRHDWDASWFRATRDCMPSPERAPQVLFGASGTAAFPPSAQHFLLNATGVGHLHMNT